MKSIGPALFRRPAIFMHRARRKRLAFGLFASLLGFDPADCLQAIHDGHMYIHQDQGGLPLPPGLDCGCAVVRLTHVESQRPEKFDQPAAILHLIVHHQDLGWFLPGAEFPSRARGPGAS